MVKIFKDNMGNYLLWKSDNKCDVFKRNGLHNGNSLCDGKEADAYVQMLRDDFENDIIGYYLTKSQKDDLEGGFLVNFDNELLDDDEILGYGNS